MSVNTAHANNGVLIHAGEYILLHSDNVSMEFSGQDNPVFRGSKQGRIYLTSHRLIFNSKKSGDEMQSFSAPFIAMNDVELEQPVFGANYIKGKVRAQPNGNFVGEVKFKLYFKSGGAIEYGMALLRAAKTAQSNYRNGGGYDDPPPYTPSGNWHEAPPPAYQPPPGYYGWLPQHDAFSGPAPNTVFMSDNPPPYPGIGGPPPAYNPQPQGLYPSVPTHPYNPQQQQPYNPQTYNPQPYNPQPYNNPPAQDWNGFGGMPQQPPQQQQQHQNQNQQQRNVSNNQPKEQEEMPSWNGFSLPPPDEEERQQQRQQQNQQSSAPPAGGWGGGYQQPPPYGAPSHPYPPYPMHPQQAGYPPYPPQQFGGGGFPPYPPAAGGNPPPAGAMGFTAPPANSKEAEALASAYNTTENQRSNRPGPSDMPPAYEDLPPNYNDTNRKEQ